MEFDAVRVYRIDTLCQLVQFLGNPVRLCLEHGDSTKHQVLLVGIVDGASIVEVEEMHGQKKRSRVSRNSTNRRSSPPNRNGIMALGEYDCQIETRIGPDSDSWRVTGDRPVFPYSATRGTL